MISLNKIINYTTVHHRVLLAHLAATLIFALYLFYPGIYQTMNQGIGTAISESGLGLIFVVGAYGGVATMIASFFCIAILLIYRLVGLGRATLSVFIAFSVSYVLVAWIRSNFGVSPLMVIVSLVLTYTIFMVSLRLTKLKFHPALSLTIAIPILWITLFYITPTVTWSGDARRYGAEDTATFNKVAKALIFTAYYPTYHSSMLPASSAQLNGYEYSQAGYTVPTVTFLLDFGHLEESGPLTNQDKAMNFTDKCFIYLMSDSMDNTIGINSQDVPSSSGDFGRCNLLQVTPSGKKVYFSQDEQATYFFTRIKNTNVVLSFANTIGAKQYSDALQPEALKVIDSLQPLSTSQLKKGSPDGFGFDQ